MIIRGMVSHHAGDLLCTRTKNLSRKGEALYQGYVGSGIDLEM